MVKQKLRISEIFSVRITHSRVGLLYINMVVKSGATSPLSRKVKTTLVIYKSRYGRSLSLLSLKDSLITTDGVCMGTQSPAMSLRESIRTV